MSWKLLPDKKMRVLSMAEVLSPEESAEVISKCKDREDMSGAGNNEFSYRHVYLNPLEWSDLYEKVTSVVLDSNVNNYEFKLHGISALYYVEFNDSSFMKWSMDLVHSSRETNKLTIHINLNEDYEGGEFWILNPDPILITPKTGLVTLFPSFIISKQDPTRAGIKRAIFGTVTGLPFS